MSFIEGRQNYANPSVIYGPIQQGDWREPVPGWGINPLWAGPAMVGVGTSDVEASSGQRSWLDDLLFFSSGLIVGGLLVYAKFSSEKSAASRKSYSANKRRRRR